RAGSKEGMQIPGIIAHGFAIASVGYRLSPVAKFPAQVHDIKAAIRFLRAYVSDYGFDSSKVIIAGASAGGHLAALVGVTNGHPELEGTVGNHSDQSSDVQAILKQSTPHGLGVRIPALQLLLRAQPEDVPDLANLASPVFHVDGNDPPLLLIHGDQDPQVPINQSHELHGKYKSLGLGDRVHLEVIHGGLHGGKPFYDEARLKLVAAFIKEALSSQ
ncbi:MAG: alpha/beta hydrolase fold domain-containing protein, partial [Verrucomicrobiales bacterium]